ncbi:uncharacterized protein LOC115624002 [Scaptodrosophila lebanonensis]|uniref:Uncharacterized protein LOC115624002 n=1 Tax=Drosophila lebanonensis TaxID=7225 RepID=A0A6J2TEK2_DROLE|nr:uncharacterized protein LOC115624002 [Scaptodrosophila lebanonensis]
MGDEIKSSASKEKFNPEDLAIVTKILSKLSVPEQLALCKDFKRLPDACTAVWRQSYRRLDFQNAKKELTGPNLEYFLQTMQGYFRHVYFTCEHLQQELNLLERAGIKQMVGVEQCEVRYAPAGMASADLSKKPPPQWPLQALPRLMRNLRRLKVHCPVEVGFIEQFAQLEYLSLYGEVAQQALTAIIAGCLQLKRLHLPRSAESLQVTGIRKCKCLRDLALPVAVFNKGNVEIQTLEQLKFLELRQTSDLEATLTAMCTVIRQRASQIEVIQVNCRYFGGPHWMRQLEMHRCRRLNGLVFVDCKFADVNMVTLGMPRVKKYAVFCQCDDLKDYQLLDFVKRCPALAELYLIGCPALTCRVLNDLYKVRHSEKLERLLKVSMSGCDGVWNEYEKNYDEYWFSKLAVIRVERLKQEDRNITDVQFFFYKPEDVQFAAN